MQPNSQPNVSILNYDHPSKFLPKASVTKKQGEDKNDVTKNLNANVVYQTILKDDKMKTFVSKFYQRISEKLQATVDDKDENKGNPHRKSFDGNFISKPERRLDAMARILVGDEACVAVCLTKNNFFIASNRNDHIANFDDKLFTRVHYLFSHLTTIALATNGMQRRAIPVTTINDTRKNIFIAAVTPLILRRLNINSHVSSETEKAKNLEELDKFLNIIIDDFNNFHKTERTTDPNKDFVEEWLAKFKLKVDKRIVRPGCLKPKLLHEKLVDPLETLLILVSKNIQDLLKLEDFYSNFKENADLIKLLAEGKLTPLVINAGSKGVHAEIRILIQLNKEDLKTSYIGIARLCCPHCNMVMQTAGISWEFTLDDEDNEFLTRGYHTNIYNWVLDDELTTNTVFLKKWLGDELYSLLEKLKTENIAVKSFFTGVDPDFTGTKSDLVLAFIQQLPAFSQAHFKNFQINEPIKVIIKRDKAETEHPDSSIPESKTSRSQKTKETLYIDNTTVVDRHEMHLLLDHNAITSVLPIILAESKAGFGSYVEIDAAEDGKDDGVDLSPNLPHPKSPSSPIAIKESSQAWHNLNMLTAKNTVEEQVLAVPSKQEPNADNSSSSAINVKNQP